MSGIVGWVVDFFARFLDSLQSSLVRFQTVLDVLTLDGGKQYDELYFAKPYGQHGRMGNPSDARRVSITCARN